MPNPLKSINTAIHKIKDGLESPGNGHGHSASPATSGHAHGDLAPSSGNGTPRPSVDAARHSESSPRASGEYQRSGTGLQAEELKGHLSRIFHIGGSQRKASHGEHSDAPTPKLDTPPHDGSTTPTKALEAKRLKEEARLAREQKDKEVHEAAELKHKEAYEADPLKAHYGAVPLAARERTESEHGGLLPAAFLMLLGRGAARPGHCYRRYGGRQRSRSSRPHPPHPQYQ
jgi:hypothetical protein